MGPLFFGIALKHPKCLLRNGMEPGNFKQKKTPHIWQGFRQEKVSYFSLSFNSAPGLKRATFFAAI